MYSFIVKIHTENCTHTHVYKSNTNWLFVTLFCDHVIYLLRKLCVNLSIPISLMNTGNICIHFEKPSKEMVSLTLLRKSNSNQFSYISVLQSLPIDTIVWLNLLQFLFPSMVPISLSHLPVAIHSPKSIIYNHL